jgi:type I restriction enzyme, S subunit
MTEVKNIPKLRFPEFSNNWPEKHLFEIMNDFIVPMRDKPIDLTGEIPWCRIEDFDGIYLSKSKSNQGVSLQTIKNMNLKVYPKNTVLVSCSANLGICAIVKNPLITNQTFIGLVPNQEVVPEYVYYMMKLSARKLNVLSTGTTISYLSREQFEKFKIHIPKTEEQQKVASFLTSVDDKINLITKKKELLEQYKKGVMQKIFSQEIRFKDDNGNDFPDWEIRKVEDLFEITRGYVLSKKQMNSEKTERDRYPVYSSQTSNNGVVGYYKEALFQDSITWTTDGANAGEVNFRKGDFYCTNVCGVLLSRDGFANNCISNILNSVTKRYVSYVGNPKLMNNVMGKIKILIPKSTEEQIKISNFINVLENKLELVNSQIEKTKEFKKGLLQQMFV